MTYTVTQEIKSQAKVFKSIYAFDLLYRNISDGVIHVIDNRCQSIEGSLLYLFHLYGSIPDFAECL